MYLMALHIFYCYLHGHPTQEFAIWGHICQIKEYALYMQHGENKKASFYFAVQASKRIILAGSQWGCLVVSLCHDGVREAERSMSSGKCRQDYSSTGQSRTCSTC